MYVDKVTILNFNPPTGDRANFKRKVTFLKQFPNETLKLFEGHYYF